MGGFGSTRWGWHRARQTTDPLLWLDVRILARQGSLTPGVWSTTSWTCRGEPSGSITHRAKADALILDYHVKGPRDADWQPVRERIPLTSTPCHYGGSRPWFLCPGCGRRRAVLFSLDGRFRCRRCHELAYSSTRETAADRALRRGDTLRRKLGGPPGLHKFPAKPKGMHWTTYERIMAEISACDHDALALFIERRTTLLRDIGRQSR